MTIVFFSTWVLGQETWYFKLTDLPYIGSVLPAIPFSQFVVAGIHIVSIALSLPFSLYNMYT
jgi:hypothetical protein